MAQTREPITSGCPSPLIGRSARRRHDERDLGAARQIPGPSFMHHESIREQLHARRLETERRCKIIACGSDAHLRGPRSGERRYFG